VRTPPRTSVVARRLASIVALFVVIVVLLLVLADTQTWVLAGVRAYVGGEALWSKGQKDAVQHLQRYAEAGSRREFDEYQQAIAVPLGDRQARLELEKPAWDRDVVRDGFVRARNHADDVPAMAWLFRRFRSDPYLAHAVDVWTTADRDIARIRRLGTMLHARHAAAGAPPVPLDPPVDAIVRKIAVLNARLTPLEEDFSRTLGAGARHAATLFLRITYGAAGLLVTVGLLLSWTMLRRIRGWETRYRHLLNSANDAILVADRETGIVLEANRRAGELTGMPLERLVGTPQSRLHPAHEQARYADIQQALRAGQAVTATLHVARAEGRLVPVEISAAVTTLEGHPVVQTLIRDVTERERAERERANLLRLEQAARLEAEQANRVKEDFLSVLSHELRTPLTPVMVWAQMLQRGPLTAELAARGLGAIERNARAQARLVEDLLDVSRIIAGKLNIQTAPVQLAPVVDAAVDAVRPAADAKQLALDVRVDAGLPAVGGDADRLRQVVANLLSNAVKFTPQAGRIEVRLTRDGDDVALTVRDTGIGITPAFLPHVFERFRQADSSTARSHPGLGLGLAIVHHLVKLHGGTVTAASDGEGRGATFTVRLPVTAGAPEASSAEHVNGETMRLRGLHVLVVDDEDDTRDLVAVLLARSGAEIRTASSAAEAVAVASRWTLDVLVSDIGMPGDDGYSLLASLRATCAEAVPAVALTAYARPEDRERAGLAGFAAHVSKPFDPEDLVAAVSRLAGR
jgi:PAS domain S-box-containing protein